MSRLRGWLLRLGGLFGRDQRERELAAEMESHLQMHIEDNLRSGMSRGAARREAQMKLGGVEQTKQICRERRGLPLLETLKPAPFAAYLFCLLDAAQFHLRLAPRCPAAHARSQIVFDVHLEMAFHLRGKLSLALVSPEESAQPQQPSTQSAHNALCQL